MKERDTQFLSGKGHICNYCDFQEELCHSIEYIENYAVTKENIKNINIQVFDCSLFTRNKK